MNRRERRTFRKLKRILTSLEGAIDINKRDVTPDRMIEDFNFDSLCLAEVAMAIESKFNVEINMFVLDATTTCGDIAKQIQQLKRNSLPAKAPQPA